ncbi:MAG: nucleoside triphosphate pyrophosphohydrolase, partial [Gammaproteobacteria bacterium]|nr:nucleoside triphosphate pyrophosphohydrolase [Gammaproteobacteria bacterium]
MQPMQQLLEVMRALRDSDTGCPWDLEQNFQSLIPYTIEEAYEVADAIERNNLNDIKSELGDLLFQIVFYSQMATEQQA